MNIRRLTKSDMDNIQGFLKKHIESSIFLLSNLQQSGVIDGDQPYQGFYVGLFIEQQLLGVASHMWNGIILLQAPIDLQHLVVHLVQKTNRPIKGLIGPWKQVLLAKQALQIPEKKITYCSREPLFHLNINELCHPSIRIGQQLHSRLATLDDLSLLIPWRVTYMMESLNAPNNDDTLEKARSSLHQTILEQHLMLLSDGDKLVSMTAFNSSIEDIVQIGGVFTPPQWRKRGYARQVVSAHLQHAARQGINNSILFTGEENYAAQSCYRSLGFKTIGEYGMLFLKDIT